MTREEAKIAMSEGKKVTHRFFTPEEWATEIDGEIHLEDGVVCSKKHFWENREQKFFDLGWELFNE